MQHNPVAPGVGAVDHAGHGNHGDSTVFGFWLYLMTDCILFGSLFAVFAVMRTSFAGGPTGKDLFDIGGVAIETGLLLLTTITYAFPILPPNPHHPNQLPASLPTTSP